MKLHKQRGFSLVELMVSVTIGLILLAGVVSIFVSSRVTFSTNERTARLQENGRVALDLITHDLRSAGYTGCSRGITYNNALNTPTSALWNYIVPVQGYNNVSGTFSPALGVTIASPSVNADSDVIVLRVAMRDGRSARLESNMTSLTDNLVVTNVGAQSLTAGNVFMISDCTGADIFQASAITAGTPNSTIAHDTSGSAPGNSSASFARQYSVGARVIPLQTIVYYVGVVGGEYGLYRKIGSGASTLLVDGVQALQISYGEDTDNDRVANVYRSAATVANWNAVISVNVALLIRSEAYGTNIDTKTYPLLTGTGMGGKTIAAANDNRQRMMFTTTATLRNRAW